MAVIANQVPPAVEQNYPPRIVVKFRAGVDLPYSEGAEATLSGKNRDTWPELARKFPGVRLTPYFESLRNGGMEALAQRGQKAGGSAPSAFASYFAVDVPPGANAQQVAADIAKWPDVETAYVEAGPTPPPLSPNDDPRSANQGYLDAAPGGVDARWAWSRADGAGVGFVDMERGWTLNHEDLAAAGVSVISGLSTDFHGHGTAVLGEITAVDNTTGCIGLAPKAATRVVSQWRSSGFYNTADAILSAVGVMSTGDVLLLEAQTTSSTSGGQFVPVEVEQAAFDAISYATSQGIVVVEAAGNGGVDLDAYVDASGKRILNRNDPDFRDSGAIMVGAASSAAPHQRLGFSNFGTRIDCFAWGENIDTCGDGWTGNTTNAYTTSFGGTSGASPIVTGAALLLQSWRESRNLSRFTPAEMRQRLSDPAINTKSANPATDRIGVMPNLRKLMARRRAWWEMVFVLAWAWLIVLGALLITPGGVLCIKCGPADPDYVGDTIINVLAIRALALGVAALVGWRSARAEQAAGG